MKYLALFTLGCFSVLVSYAYGTSARPVHTVHRPVTAEVDMDPRADATGGYGKAERGAVVKLWKRVERDIADRESAATLAMVYGITAENADSYRGWWK